jgi:hypothetical protein
VDRTGAIEQEHVVGVHRRTAAPPAHTFATRLGRLGSEDLGTRTEQPDQVHRTTLAPGGDILGGRSVRSFDRWGKIGPRETRSKPLPSRSRLGRLHGPSHAGRDSPSSPSRSAAPWACPNR